ncbi:MAG TPA: hypothetical protein VD907_05330 [Verrucomicrobiae bacterium]|nr:hypothetical protein [Verrucomicrobiae bacterium]
MRKNDIAIIILIASISALVAFFIGKAVIGEPQQQSVKVKTIEAITTEVTPPESTIFNKDGINPTVEINIGNPSNRQPFGE